ERVLNLAEFHLERNRLIFLGSFGSYTANC
ncbi:uncharacterized protein METZ01_LOCUS191278, partial [marine metagenome]